MINLAETLAYEKRGDEAIPLFETLLKNAAKSEGIALPDAHYQYAVGLTILGRHMRRSSSCNKPWMWDLQMPAN